MDAPILLCDVCAHCEDLFLNKKKIQYEIRMPKISHSNFKRCERVSTCDISEILINLAINTIYLSKFPVPFALPPTNFQFLSRFTYSSNRINGTMINMFVFLFCFYLNCKYVQTIHSSRKSSKTVTWKMNLGLI